MSRRPRVSIRSSSWRRSVPQYLRLVCIELRDPEALTSKGNLHNLRSSNIPDRIRTNRYQKEKPPNDDFRTSITISKVHSFQGPQTVRPLRTAHQNLNPKGSDHGRKRPDQGLRHCRWMPRHREDEEIYKRIVQGDNNNTFLVARVGLLYWT